MSLSDELANDPLGRGYADMTDQETADSLNAANRSRFRTAIPAPEVFEAIVPAEYAALTADQKTRLSDLLGMGTVNAAGANTRATFAALFGAATQTRANLNALASETVSRAEELGLGRVKPGYVATARAA